MKLVPLREAMKILGLCKNTLRRYADEQKIKSIRTPGNQRLFDVEDFLKTNEPRRLICYCRVSSHKQKDDLIRQVAHMRTKFPDAQIVQDIGSGINYKRKGLRSLLERTLCGEKLTIVVAHRDRLARFGFELIEYIVQQIGGEIMVLDRTEYSPQRELTEDLLTILHVFSCRMHGLRRYSDKIKEDKSLSVQGTKKDS